MSGKYYSVQELLEEYDVPAPKKKQANRIVKSYEYQKSMLYAIQAITNQQTHEILANLVEEADKVIANSDINLKEIMHHSYRNERRLSKYMFYPGTKLYIGIYINYSVADYRTDQDKYDSMLKYNFKLPTSLIKLDQKEFDEYITDGILCDSSKDIDKPKLKGTLTQEERELRKLKADKKREAKEADKKAKAAKKLAYIKSKKISRY